VESLIVLCELSEAQIFLQGDPYHPSITEISVKLRASGVFLERTSAFGMYMFCLDCAEKGNKGVSLVATLTKAFWLIFNS
jgi:hypothetical protein